MFASVTNADNYALNPYAVPLLITAAAILLLGTVTLLRERRSHAAPALFALVVTLLIWVFAYAWMYSATDAQTALWWGHIAHIGIIAIPAAAYHFTVVVVNRLKELEVWVWSAWGLSLLLIAISLGTDWFLTEARRYPWSFHPMYGPAGHAYIAFLLITWSVCVRLYWQAYHHARPGTNAQQRAKYLGIIFAVSMVGSIDFAPAYGLAFLPVGYLGVSFLAVLIAYVTWRYRLIDITPAFAAQKIIETINDGLIVMDTEGIVRVTNHTACTLLGYEDHALLGKNLSQPLGLAVDTLDKTSNGESLSHYETEYHHPTGITRHFAISSSVMRAGDGSPTAFVCVLRDITEHKQAAKQMHQLAFYDSLTQLPNREHFRQVLERALATAQDQHQHQHEQLALLFIDLDHFKRINDSLGHSVGDQLLHAVANRLRQSVRDTQHHGDERGNESVVARLGGDEFVVMVYPISRTEDAYQIAERLLSVLSHPFRLKEHDLFVGASIGISLYPRDGDSAESLLKYADTAMYEAKKAGRGHYRIYEKRMNNERDQRFALESGLRAALDRDELILHYQPQFDLRQQVPIGVEALLRWFHPQRGLLLPATFMAGAEESGLIVPLGEWVLRKACIQARHWQKTGHPDLRIAVNVSLQQLRHPDFVAQLTATLNACGLPPTSLALEIDEAALGQHEALPLTHCLALSVMGVKLIINDFGGGHASLRQLTQFPVTGVKIDRLFMRDIDRGGSHAAIAAAIIALTRSLGLEVMAEGVENSEQLDFLREHQCHLAQGRLLGDSLPAAQLDLSGVLPLHVQME